MSVRRAEAKLVQQGSDVMTTVGVVVVNYHNKRDTLHFLQSLSEASMPDGCVRHVVVVDNGGELKSSEVEEFGDNVMLLHAPHNLGYVNGGNFGIKTFEDQFNKRPCWWVLANADVRVEPSFFQCLLTSSWPDSIGGLSPDVREEGDWPRNPFYVRRPSPWKIQARVLLYSSTVLTAAYLKAARWKRAISRPPSVPATSRFVYATHGSLLVFHRRFFDRGGTLQYSGFLYGEEIHIAEQLQEMGLNLLWSPSLQAQHRGRAVMRHVPTEKRRRWWKESYELIYRDYFRE